MWGKKEQNKWPTTIYKKGSLNITIQFIRRYVDSKE